MNFEKDKIERLLTELESKKNTKLGKIFIGFDGFIDEIVRVVDKRHNANEFTAFSLIEDYVKRNSLATNRSINIELVPERIKIGGNAPIMANSMSSHGVSVTFVGAIGKPKIHPVFKEFSQNNTTISIGNPGHSDALEFSNGKIILGKIEPMKYITWENIIKEIPEKQFIELLRQSEIICTVNWTMIPYMNDIWNNLKRLIKENNIKAKTLFIDLADFQKRTQDDSYQCFEKITELTQSFNIILGLNLKELCQTAELLNISLPDAINQENMIGLSEQVYKQLNIEELIIHKHDFVLSITDKGLSSFNVKYTSTPKISTGAGDHFNAGYITAKLYELSSQSKLVLATLNSNYYIRTAISPSLEQIIQFAELCLEDKEESICI